MDSAAWGAIGLVGAAFVATIPAWAAARSSARTRKEVMSPNGISSGDMNYESWKRLQGIEAGQAQFRELMAQSRERQVAMLEAQSEHATEDERRFGLIFKDLERINERLT